jgi:hypothetical protein
MKAGIDKAPNHLRCRHGFRKSYEDGCF